MSAPTKNVDPAAAKNVDDLIKLITTHEVVTAQRVTGDGLELTLTFSHAQTKAQSTKDLLSHLMSDML